MLDDFGQEKHGKAYPAFGSLSLFSLSHSPFRAELFELRAEPFTTERERAFLLPASKRNGASLLGIGRIEGDRSRRPSIRPPPSLLEVGEQAKRVGEMARDEIGLGASETPVQ